MGDGLKANDDFSWSDFDPEAYFQHYYGEPHADDDRILELACAALKKASPPGRTLRTLEVGTGPNLCPLFAALPRARRATAWEYADSNLDWLTKEIESGRNRPQWAHFWNVARRAYGEDLPDAPFDWLREAADVRQGSIFDLPKGEWDAATMFFCAESITERQDEFEAACASFARAVRPGGHIIAAFLANSDGYTVSDHAFPALRIDAAALRDAFVELTHDLEIEAVGLVDQEIRSGYTGCLFLTARAR